MGVCPVSIVNYARKISDLFSFFCIFLFLLYEMLNILTFYYVIYMFPLRLFFLAKIRLKSSIFASFREFSTTCIYIFIIPHHTKKIKNKIKKSVRFLFGDHVFFFAIFAPFSPPFRPLFALFSP